MPVWTLLLLTKRGPFLNICFPPQTPICCWAPFIFRQKNKSTFTIWLKPPTVSTPPSRNKKAQLFTSICCGFGCWFSTCWFPHLPVRHRNSLKQRLQWTISISRHSRLTSFSSYISTNVAWNCYITKESRLSQQITMISIWIQTFLIFKFFKCIWPMIFMRYLHLYIFRGDSHFAYFARASSLF